MASKPARINDSCTDRKSTRLNSSHLGISYAVFCLKKKTDIRHLFGLEDGVICSAPASPRHTSDSIGASPQNTPRAAMNMSPLFRFFFFFFLKSPAPPELSPLPPPPPSPT